MLSYSFFHKRWTRQRWLTMQYLRLVVWVPSNCRLQLGVDDESDIFNGHSWIFSFLLLCENSWNLSVWVCTMCRFFSAWRATMTVFFQGLLQEQWQFFAFQPSHVTVNAYIAFHCYNSERIYFLFHFLFLFFYSSFMQRYEIYFFLSCLFSYI